LVEVLINGVKEPVKVKISKDADLRLCILNPEFDDLKRLAEKNS